MTTKNTQNKIALRVRSKLVAKGLSGSAIGRSINPPASRQAVSQAIYGKKGYGRIRTAIADALGEPVSELWPVKSSEKAAA